MRIAAELGPLLAQHPQDDLELDLNSYLSGRERGPGVFVVMKDGRTASSTGEPLPDEYRRAAQATLGGVDLSRSGGAAEALGRIRLGAHPRRQRASRPGRAPAAADARGGRA